MTAPENFADVIGVSFRVGQTEEWENFPRICVVLRMEFLVDNGAIWALWGMN